MLLQPARNVLPWGGLAGGIVNRRLAAAAEDPDSSGGALLRVSLVQANIPEELNSKRPSHLSLLPCEEHSLSSPVLDGRHRRGDSSLRAAGVLSFVKDQNRTPPLRLDIVVLNLRIGGLPGFYDLLLVRPGRVIQKNHTAIGES